MTRRRWGGIFLGLAIGWLTAGAEDATRVIVKGQRVNLRARPHPEAEVLGQVNDGETLVARRKEGEWVEVEIPVTTDVWVHKDFVRDGVVQVSRLQVRAGPGINYGRVGVLEKGMKVEPRGSFGEWLKIAPPPGTTAWVNRAFLIYPEAPKPTPAQEAAVAAPPPTPPSLPPPKPRPPTTAQSRPVTPRPPPPPPAEFRLAPGIEQGRLVQREGYIEPVGYLLHRPSRYLLASEQAGRMVTASYLWGNDEQLAGLRGRLLVIEGREYWLQGLRRPMLVIERIRLVNP